MDESTIKAMVSLVENMQTEADAATLAAFDAIASAREELDLVEAAIASAVSGKKHARPTVAGLTPDVVEAAFNAIDAEKAMWKHLNEATKPEAAEAA